MESSLSLNFYFQYALKCAGIISFGIWISWIWQRRHFYKFSLKVPTCWGFPVLGILPFIGHVNNLLSIIEYFYKQKRCNNICIWMGVHPVIFTQDIEFINSILQNPKYFEKSKTFYQPLLEILGDNLVLSPFPKWQRTRGKIEANFKRKELLNFFPIFNEARKIGLNKLEHVSDGQPHTLPTVIYPMILGISLDRFLKSNTTGTLPVSIKHKNLKIIFYSDATLGLKLVEDKLTEELIDYFSALPEIIMVQTFAGFLNLEFISLWYSRHKYQSLFLFTKDLVEQSILDIKGSPVLDEKSKLLVERLLECFETKDLSWDNIISESIAMILASFETVANTIISAMALLATHPDIQNELYCQLKEKIPNSNADINIEILSQLPYLDQIIKEVLRLNPPFSFIARHVIKNTSVKEFPFELPRNMQVMISIFHLHRRTDIWGPDAASFRPERFSNENLTTTQSKAYMPFSKGPRNCIGWRYAQFSLKVIIAGFIRHFEFNTDLKYEDLRPVDHVTLKFETEPSFIIKKRVEYIS